VRGICPGLDAAINPGADAIATFNQPDPSAARFGIEILSPVDSVRRMARKPS
jgi:hypothetical protein